MVKIPKGLGGTAKQLGSNLLEITYACYLAGFTEGKKTALPKTFLEFTKNIKAVHVEGQKIRRGLRNGTNI